MKIRQKRSVFETRVDVLDAVKILGDDAICSRIASVANISQSTLLSHLSFLQVKDLVTVADHTVEDRDKLQRRSKSSVFRITPEGRRILSAIIPVRDHLTSDKQKDWRDEIRNPGNAQNLLTV